MKRIGILSDTHNYLDPKILHYFKDCDGFGTPAMSVRST